MTTVYFIRHCQSDKSVTDPMTRPLTPKGLADRRAVERYLEDKPIAAVFSSPYKRAYDTVASFAAKRGLGVAIIDGFRERKSDTGWPSQKQDAAFLEHQWKDFDYTASDGETLAQVQQRNLRALRNLIRRYPKENVAVGAHGTALATLLHYYDASFGFEEFMNLLDVMPYAAKFVFDGEICLAVEIKDILKCD